MPKLRWRVTSWLWVALLLAMVAGFGLEWVWSHRNADEEAGADGTGGSPGFSLRWGRKGADLVTRCARAYHRGDWDRAADLARQRLKTAPEDLEARRYLARATARLGRDVAANAMFARLGSAALQAEDYFLLGVGLDRAGRKTEAEGVWRKAIQLDPDHAEAIEQLIIRDTALNRLAEAAQLAERLAHRPGWEFRGEINLGALRAELSDPAGAATVLGQALNRPEARQMDRAMAVRYRNLLARTLLQTGRPGEARSVLRSVLDEGPDAQASWLLSRAALLEGTLPEATTALEASGSYRAEHPLEAEPSPFVGESRCADCHREEFRAVTASRHASTFVRGEALSRLPYPDRTLPDPDDPAVTHALAREGGAVHFETRARDQVAKAIVAYAFGSPDHYVSLVGRDQAGVFRVLRLSRFQNGPESGWVRTTGHAADAGEGHDILGKALDPVDGVLKCLFCHTTNPRAILEKTGPESNDRGIGCERCHGPGAVHEKAIAGRFRDPAIVSPGVASGEARLRLCAQCHGHHQPSPLPRTDPFWIRFQGTTLPWSRCYTDSAGAFDCMSCHDPHHDTDRTEAHYTERCLTCHSPKAGKGRESVSGTPPRTHPAAACPVNPAKGCVGCHMPSFESKPLHARFTDHYIRVHLDRKSGESQ